MNALAKTNPQQGLSTVDPVSEWTALRSQADALVKSRFLPRAVDTPEKAVAIMLMGRELGIGPMQALRSVHIIEGKPTMSSELIAGLVLARLPGSTLRVSSTTNEECTVEAARAGQPATTFRFSIKDAQAAQLTGKDNWKKYPAAMLRARCLTAAARAMFPDATMGLYDPDELGAITGERGEIVSLQALPRVQPHDDPDDFVQAEGSESVFAELANRLAMIENSIAGARSYDDSLVLRELLGSKAKQSPLTKDIQTAGERNELNAEQRKELGKCWQRCARQLEKVEKEFPPPDAMASFVDADPEQDGR